MKIKTVEPVDDRRDYNVVAQVTISVHTVVEAGSIEEAIELAQERSVIQLCHQCASGDEMSEWVTSGELDGEPTDLRVEEC
jgi:hypothetical protein